MKKTIALLAILLTPVFCLAANLQTDSKLDISEKVKNLYAFSQETKTSNDISGDALIFSQNIDITKKVERNLLAVGGNLDISGDIGANARLIGQDIVLSGTIGEDTLVMANSLKIKGANIKGDLWILSGSVDIADADISGNVKISSPRIIIKGSVGGDAQIQTSNLTIEENAHIGGTLTYWSDKEGSISSEAKIKKGPYFNQIKKNNFSGISSLTYSLLSIVILALAIAYGFREQVIQIAKDGPAEFARNFGWGLLAICALPITFTLIFFISTHLALLILGLYIIFLIIAYGLSAVYVGTFIRKTIFKDKSAKLDWVVILIGSFAYLLIGYIPTLGGIIKFIIYAASFGYLFNKMYTLIKSQSARTKSSK